MNSKINPREVLVFFSNIIAFFCISGCNEAFNPNAPFEPKMVVYSFLTTESDSQFVRVYSTYNALENNPSFNTDEPRVTDAKVTISNGTTTFTLQPIVVPRADTSRYKSNIKAYFVYPFRPQKGKDYTLTIASSTHGSITARCSVPEKGGFSDVSTRLLDNPWSGSEPIIVKARLSDATRGFLVRFFVEYETYLTTPNERVIQRVEVPINLHVVDCLHGIYNYVLPIMVPRISKPGTPEGSDGFLYNAFGYRRTIELINEQNREVRFKRAVFYLVQFDENFYNYYGLTNAFKDKYTTRLDESDFTNINRGVGVFGSLTVDSISYVLPETMFPPGFSSPCQ